jgi:peptide deformylase
MALEIVTYPDLVLRRPAAPLSAIDGEVRARAREMLALMYENRGVGLAAPQVAWSVRLFVMNPTGEPEDERVYANPRIVAKSKEKEKAKEGCLSLPEIEGKIERFVRIRLAAMDLEGRPLEVDLENFPARVAQHEIDHLDGVLIIDRMSTAERALADPKLRDLVLRAREKSESAARKKAARA